MHVTVFFHIRISVNAVLPTTPGSLPLTPVLDVASRDERQRVELISGDSEAIDSVGKLAASVSSPVTVLWASLEEPVTIG